MMKLVSTLILFCASIAVVAQQTSAPVQPTRCRTFVRRVVKAAPKSSLQKSADFFVGEAKVNVTKDETVVRLAMAQHGSVLIELPANDGPRYIIPGDPEMATVDQKALERNKRVIIVRPGTQFVTPSHNVKVRTPAATVTAQMRSGLVVTFLFYPVEDLAQNVHRCVLSYNRDEVVARRRAVGLPVNLDTETRGELTEQSTAPISVSVEKASSEKPLELPTSPTLVAANAANVDSTTTNGSEFQPIASIQEALQQAIKTPKQFRNWTRSVHGLALSIINLPVSQQSYRLAVLALKSSSSEPLKLAQGSPELAVETLDEQGRPLNVETIKKAHLESSDPTGLVQPGQTVYYAVAYVTPLLGAHQRVRISISQSNAADEPASIIVNNK
jgi:hypothetical protein